jgi:DNA polymerase-3 subunit epsilon
VRLDDPHSAVGDARATAGLLAFYLGMARTSDASVLYATLASEATHVVWPPARVEGQRPQPTAAPVVVREPKAVSPPLAQLLDAQSLSDALDEGAPEGALPYLEMLATAFEDGLLTDDEQRALNDLAHAYGMSEADVRAANQGFVVALAHQALADGKLARAEKRELDQVAVALGVHATVLEDVVEHAERARLARLSQGLRELPADWAHGDPLRVGQKVVFTGCDPDERTQLESRAERLGVRVIGAVSKRVAMLVTDGTFDGTKAADANRLGIRVVTPSEFSTLLDYLQPARLPRHAAALTLPSDSTVANSNGSRTLPNQVASPNGGEPPRDNPAEIRRWARENGYSVGVRGRIDSIVIAAYDARSTV